MLAFPPGSRPRDEKWRCAVCALLREFHKTPYRESYREVFVFDPKSAQTAQRPSSNIPALRPNGDAGHGALVRSELVAALVEPPRQPPLRERFVAVPLRP